MNCMKWQTCMNSYIFKCAYIYYCADKWTKKVNVRRQERDNWRIKVILAILAFGEKLAPLLNFKTKEEDTERKCSKYRE